jgi:hypothetical protein
MVDEAPEMITDTEEWRADEPPTNLLDFITWLRTWLDKIPVECRSTAEIKFGVTDSYGVCRSRIEISYRRPEALHEQERHPSGEPEGEGFGGGLEP